MQDYKIYKDDFGNYAVIKEIEHYPYRDAPEETKGYQLICYSKYNNNLMYFASIYETEIDALKQLNEFSCGTFKERSSL